MSAPASSKEGKAPVKDPKTQKLAFRVTSCIENEAVNNKVGPKQIDPNWILVSPLNRLGTAPNVQRIHWGDPVQHHEEWFRQG